MPSQETQSRHHLPARCHKSAFWLAIAALATLSHVAAAQNVRSEPYTWKSVQMVGGGFVDGIIFHPALPGLSYARTDIGGAYRRDDQHKPWTAITDWVSLQDVALLGPESIAVDPNDPDKLYIAAGMYPTQRAAVLRSSDRGRTFERTNVPFTMGGNSDGRGNGERLMVDPNDGRVLFFGSRSHGLWRSTDGAVTWSRVESFPTPAPEAAGAGGAGMGRGMGGPGGGDGIIFVVYDPKSGSKGKACSTIYAGVSLIGQNSLFRSQDAGATWKPVPGQQTALRPTHGIWASDGTLYISYSTTPGPGGGTNGAVWKLNTTTDTWTDITPIHDPGCGFAAVSVDAKNPQTLIASTTGARRGEEIYRTTDAGKSWKPLIHNPAAPCLYDYSGHPYVAHTGIHWLSDIEIDPFDSNHALFTVGYGGWETFNLSDIDQNKPVKWVTDSTGIEETVALALLSPTDGPHLLTAIGDYGGFVHWNLDQPAPEGNFTNPFFSNTTDIAAGYQNPNVIVRVGAPGGGQNTGTRAAIGFSLDAGKTWQPPTNPPAGANGTIAVSSDGNRWIWSPGGATRVGGALATGDTAPTMTADRGHTWTPCTGLPPNTRVVADSVNPLKFYALNLFAGTLYTSTDGGSTFITSPLNLPGDPIGGGATGRGNRGDNRGGQDKLYATPGLEGDLWIAAYEALFHSPDSGKTFERLDPFPSQLAAFGFGKPAPNSSYPALYTVATLQNPATHQSTRGIFRSDDQAKTWTRINDDDHQFGLILQITGDPRIYGRVYVGTHGRGTLYGDLLAK
jgi:photosystem II stability/assembly factor-like uncharacterized protein